MQKLNKRQFYNLDSFKAFIYYILDIEIDPLLRDIVLYKLHVMSQFFCYKMELKIRK